MTKEFDRAIADYHLAAQLLADAQIEEDEAFVRFRLSVSSDGQAERMARVETRGRVIVKEAELDIARYRLDQAAANEFHEQAHRLDTEADSGPYLN